MTAPIPPSSHLPASPAGMIPPAQTPQASSTNRRFASLRTIGALMLREMSTRYGRTPGGYIWAVLEPMAAIIFLSLGFALIVRSPSLGTSFLLFYASGYLPFNLYGNISRTAASSVRYSAGLLKYPAVTWIDALFARFTLNSLTDILIGVLLIGGIMMTVDAHAVFSPLPVLAATALTMLLALGVGTVNCVLFGLFPLWSTTWSILNRPLFLASGVIFLYEDLPQTAQSILWYNPLAHIIGLFRRGIYPTYTASYVSPMYVIITSLVLITLGLILMGRFHREVLNKR